MSTYYEVECVECKDRTWLDAQSYCVAKELKRALKCRPQLEAFGKFITDFVSESGKEGTWGVENWPDTSQLQRIAEHCALHPDNGKHRLRVVDGYGQEV